jgi:hypothetical protein
MLALPLVGLWGVIAIPEGEYFAFQLFGFNLTPVRVDGLSLVFGYVFHIGAAICVIFAFHIRDTMQQVAGLIYAGSAIGGVFAGDLLSLFVYWEGTAIASVFLIWATRTEAAYHSGMRYLIIQVASGVLLLGGAIVVINHRDWDQGGLPAATQLDAGFIPAGDGDRHGIPVLLHHQAGHLCARKRLPGNGVVDMDRRRHGCLPIILYDNRIRSAAGTGLQSKQPAWFHDDRGRDRY